MLEQSNKTIDKMQNQATDITGDFIIMLSRQNTNKKSN